MNESRERLISRIERLSVGQLAQLRRAAGDRLADRRDHLWFVGIARSPRTEAVDYLVATLLAQYSAATIERGGHRGTGTFGTTYRKTLGPDPTPSLQRRFQLLLEADFQSQDGSGDLPYRLRQAVKLARDRGVGIDWVQLTRDLDRWSYPEREVQKEWARAFFVGSSQEQPTPPSPESSHAH